MNDENKFFSLNHELHFLRGFLHNINIKNGLMEFSPDSKEALFVSSAFDTRELNNVWHRAALIVEKPNNSRYALAFYASNSKTVIFPNGTKQDLDIFLKDTGIPDSEKAQALLKAQFWSREYIDAKDILLHEFKGRYLWFKLVVTGGSFPKISRIRLYYPLSSFVRYLPDSYQTNHDSFFVRFVALFQSLYLDLDEKIETFHLKLDPSTAPSKFLKMLMEWMGLDPFLSANEPRLRLLVEEAAHLCSIWGTKQSLERALLLICGEMPFIQEHFESAPFTFTVLISGKADRKLAVTVIDEIKPAHTCYSLVSLKQSLILDAHTYIGINSRLSDYPPLRLDSGTGMGVHEL